MSDPQPTCDYCGWLGWTVERHGRVTHKEACPHRTDPWHQGDPQTAAPRLPAWRGTEAPTVTDDLLGRLQFWLQAHGDPPPYRPWVAWRLGNLISDLRYWWWRLRGERP